MTGRRSGCHRDTGTRIRGARDIESWFCTTGLPAQVAIAGCIALSALPAIAQEAELEEIFVTGSRIARPDFESAGPVVTVPAERFEQTGYATVEATLNSMPQFVGQISGTTNYIDFGGQALASLRGLSWTSTLVLIDGRRLVPASRDGVPDLNLIPPSLIDRVEILTGGASAVYGSDALAGVVNLHLLDRFEGLEMAADWSETSHTDGQTYTFSLTGGTSFGDGRGSAMAVASYTRRDQVNQSERKYSRVPLVYYGPGTDGVGPGGQFLPEGSNSILEGRVNVAGASREAFNALFESYGYATGTVPYQAGFGFNSDGTLFTLGNREPNSVANFRGVRDPQMYNDRAYSYNFAPTNAMQLPLDRTAIFANGSFKFSDSVELYAQGVYADYTASVQWAPVPANQLSMPPTNPYVPRDLKLLLDSRPSPTARMNFAKRMQELGPRIWQNDYETYQATLGSRGTVGGNWKYDTYVQYGQTDQTTRTSGNLSRSKFEELLYAPDGGKAICGGLNPFGLGSISAECARYVAVDLEDGQTIRQLTGEYSIRGSPLTLPAGPVEAVVGLFYKKDDYIRRPDQALAVVMPDGRPEICCQGSAQANVDGSDHNLDLYVEALLPVLSEWPGVRRLQAVVGYRYSDYASAGGTSSYKAELLYEPVDPVHFRGAFEHAVRAPSVFQLYNPQIAQEVGFDQPDPCSVGSAERIGPNAEAVSRLCLAQGMPAALLGTFDFPGGYVDGFVGGNPDLGPETSRTYTAGMVFDSRSALRALEHLQVSVDWWDIRIDHAIGQLAFWYTMPLCYDAQYNPKFELNNFYCKNFTRDTETGVIVDAYEILRNVSSVETSGIDLQLDWRMDVGRGQLGMNWLATWTDYFKIQDAPEAKVNDWAHTGCCPTLAEWRWNLDVRYRIGNASAGAIWRYIGSFQDWAEADFGVPATNYFDADFLYEFGEGWLEGLAVRAGVTNVFDEMPPILPTAGGANTDPGSFDVLGRRYFVSADYRIRPGGH
jgi:outer membrane receptor protein involved in Fe transport